MALSGEQALAVAKKYVNDTCVGLGAVKGANCTVYEIKEDVNATVVTFKWTGTNGAQQTSKITVKDGLSITAVDVDTEGRLHCTLSDGSTVESIGTINLSDYLKKSDAEKTYQPKGDYATTAYITQIFEELKRLIQSGDYDDAVAVLDEAILDLTTLA